MFNPYLAAPLILGLRRYIQPGVTHVVLTVSEVDSDLEPRYIGALLLGAHFYCLATMRQTMIARWRHSRWADVVTNADKPESETLLHRIAFWVYGMKEELFQDVPDLEASHIAGRVNYRLPPDGVLCLIFQILSAEEFEVRLPDDSPPIVWPPNFMLQRHNAAAIMSDLLCMIREVGGDLWNMWLALVAEMDDRAIYDDDVPSHCRRLIRHAQALKSSTISPTSVLDKRFIHHRQAFYDQSSHITGEKDPGEDEATRSLHKQKGGRKKKAKTPTVTRGPQQLPPWSFLTEGGYLTDVAGGVAKFPGSIQANLLEEWCVLHGKRDTSPDDISPDLPEAHPEIEQRQKDFEAVLESLVSSGDDWATRLELGNMTVNGSWVGMYDSDLYEDEEI